PLVPARLRRPRGRLLAGQGAIPGVATPHTSQRAPSAVRLALALLGRLDRPLHPPGVHGHHKRHEDPVMQRRLTSPHFVLGRRRSSRTTAYAAFGSSLEPRGARHSALHEPTVGEIFL